MKDFFEDLGKRISETADDVVNKAGEVMETQKIRAQIRTLKRSNDRDFADMGKTIYDQFKEGKVLDESVIAFCEEIEKREEAMEKYEKEILNRKES